MEAQRRGRPAGIPKVVLLIESSRSSGRALLAGIANYAHQHGPWSFYWEPGGLEKAWPVLQALEADGVILRDLGAVDEALAGRMPAVVVGHSQPEVRGAANVVTDSPAVGRLAAEHLLQCGFRHFAYCGYAGSPWSQLRGEAFRRRVEEAGWAMHLYGGAGSPGQASWRKERQSLAAWLGSRPKPLGLMACNDDRGQQVIEACRTAGLAVPDAVAVVGADNDELVCRLSDPPMSSVRIDFEKAGYEAARALDHLMKGTVASPATITAQATHVVARRSTNILAIEDPHVARALQFILDQVDGKIAVGDVARAAAVSRRALEKRFRSEINRSILQEIRRVRVEKICRLLLETELPVQRIADALGYADTQHFARYFRSEKGVTPTNFRRGARSAGR